MPVNVCSGVQHIIRNGRQVSFHSHTEAYKLAIIKFIFIQEHFNIFSEREVRAMQLEIEDCDFELWNVQRSRGAGKHSPSCAKCTSSAL